MSKEIKDEDSGKRFIERYGSRGEILEPELKSILRRYPAIVPCEMFEEKREEIKHPIVGWAKTLLARYHEASEEANWGRWQK